MQGETDLKLMLESLKPALDPRRFTFSTHPGMSMAEAAALNPLAAIHETEGLTLIAENGDGPRYAMITLTVHSSLEAVGLTAAVSKVLAGEGISANMVAAFFHDHIFVSEKDAERAMTALQNLATAPE